MNEPMKKYMKTGIIHFMSYPETMRGEGPILETVKKIATDDYFDAIEISWNKDPTSRKAMKDILSASGMTVAYGAQPRLLTTGLNINDLDEAGRQKALATLKEGIDEAYELGATGFAFLSGNYNERKKEEAYSALVQSTVELCKYAKSKGDLRVALEVFDFDIDKKSLIGPTTLAKRFADDISKDCDNFGLLVDLSHLPLVRETAREAIIPIWEYLVHVHIGNAVTNPALPAYGDAHPRFGFPGGENNVDELVEFLRVLLEVGFLNEKNPPIVSFEVKPFGDEDPDVVIANSKRILNRAWALV